MCFRPDAHATAVKHQKVAYVSVDKVCFAKFSLNNVKNFYQFKHNIKDDKNHTPKTANIEFEST